MKPKSPRGDSNSTDDPFEKLPDDALVSIFAKLPEFLTQCILVCWRFATTIHRGAPNLSITLPSLPPFWRIVCLIGYSDMPALRSQIKSSYAETTNFLNKFVGLRSLHVAFPYDNNEGHGEQWFCNWKVKVETDCYTVVYLQSDSIRRWVKEDDLQLGARQRLSLVMLKFWTEVVLAHDLLVMLVKDYPKLESVMVSITENTQKICVSGNELLKLKMLITTLEGEWENFFCGIRNNLKRGIIPRLVLPVSGLVLENVVVLIKRICHGEATKDDNDIIAWEYGEDEKVFEEAIKAVLMNHRGSLSYTW